MDPSAKPLGFGKSSAELEKNHHLQKLKPVPPSHRHYQPDAEFLGEAEDMRNGINNARGDAHDFTIVEHPKEDLTSTDFGPRDVFNIVKSLDANRYATKKTIAQGMLDIALLTANASQLKYILQVGKHHEFYTLMLTLICTSIALQVVQGIICVLLGSTFNINKTRDQPKANVWNNLSLALMVLTVAVNVIISAFDMRGTDDPATNGTLADPGKSMLTGTR